MPAGNLQEALGLCRCNLGKPAEPRSYGVWHGPSCTLSVQRGLNLPAAEAMLPSLRWCSMSTWIPAASLRGCDSINLTIMCSECSQAHLRDYHSPPPPPPPPPGALPFMHKCCNHQPQAHTATSLTIASFRWSPCCLLYSTAEAKFQTSGGPYLGSVCVLLAHDKVCCMQIYLLILYIPLLIAYFDETNW